MLTYDGTRHQLQLSVLDGYLLVGEGDDEKALDKELGAAREAGVTVESWREHRSGCPKSMP